MRLPPRSRVISRQQPALSGDFEVPGVTLLAFARQVLGSSLGPHRRIRRIVRQQLMAEVHRASSIQVEYDLVEPHGSRQEIACRFFDQYGTLLAEANVEIDLLS